MSRVLMTLCTLLFLIGARAEAQDLRVVYLDGTLQIRQGSGWRALRIGEPVPADVSLQLAKGSVAELAGRVAGGEELRVTLTQPGSYSVAALFKASREAASWGFGRLLAAKLRAFFAAPGARSPTAMGARAGEAESEIGMEWADEEQDAARKGRQLLEQGRFEEAVDSFQEALAVADAQMRPYYLFLIGTAWSLAGRNAQALQALEQAQPPQTAPYFADYALLKGRVLLEAQSYAQALALFDALLASPAPLDRDAAQPAWFLSAFCSLQLGDASQARERLLKARSLGSDTDFGRQATELLNNQ